MSQQNTATETSSAAELAELRDSVRDFLAAKSGEQRVRAAIETERGYDEDLWQQMAVQLSLPGLALPEEYGGDGFTFTELQVVLEETGPRPDAEPVPRLRRPRGGRDPRDRRRGGRQGLPAGHRVGEDHGHARGRGIRRALVVRRTDDDRAARRRRQHGASAWHSDGDSTGGGWLLTGTKQFVLHGATADLLIVAAHTEQGPAFFAVQPGDQAGATLTRTALRTLDLTRPMATLQFSDTPATLIGTAGTAGRGA